MLDQQPVFVVASPGSGAAVLFEVLDRARETLRLRDEDIIKLRKLGLTSNVTPTPAQRQTLRRIYREAARGARRVVVSDVMRLGISIATAHAVWPRARFVYLYRNAGEHIAAAERAANAGAQAWEISTRKTLDALAALPAAAWCAVNYADLLQDTDGEAQWLGHMLGLTWTTSRPGAGAARRHHRAVAALQHAGRPTLNVLPDALVALAQRAETLQQRHHPAWVAGDTVKARQRRSSRKTLERFQRAVVSSHVAAGLCLATAVPTVARATSYQVLNLGDAGAGSLRDALNQANTNAGLDTITFPNLSGTVTLTSGALKIKDSVSVDGNGTIIVDGNHASTVFYPYSPDPNNPIDVTIANLTVQNAHSTNHGGAIDSNNANLAVENCVIQNNVAQGSGGGIYAGGTADANISVVNSVIQNNNALTQSGGGIALGGGNTTFSMIATTVVGNYAANNAGGVVVAAGPLTTATIENSAILDNNSSNAGAGIYFQSLGDLVVQNSNISGNKTPTNTAGLYAHGVGSQGGNVIIDSCTLSNNVGNQGAALQTWHGATLAMRASTVVGNSAPSGGSGGLLIGAPYSGTATITDCTITGNSGQKAGGMAVASAANIIIESSTITGNTGAQSNGGGVFFYNGATGIIHNSIIAHNAANAAPAQIGGQIRAYAAVSFSLVSDINDVVANSNVVIVANTNNILGQDPNLSPLGNYGGPTATFLPAPDSPVVNAGDPNQAGLPQYDQRGLTRVVQGLSDMGSVELQLCGPGNLETQAGCAGATTGTTTSGTTTSGTTTGTTAGGTTSSGTTAGTTTSGTTSSATTGGTTTVTTTGGSKGNGGSSGCAAAPTANNPFASIAFAATALGLLQRRRK